MITDKKSQPISYLNTVSTLFKQENHCILLKSRHRLLSIREKELIIARASRYASKRRYLNRTPVLETTFQKERRQTK
jgi:hypothetical protein